MFEFKIQLNSILTLLTNNQIKQKIKIAQGIGTLHIFLGITQVVSKALFPRFSTW